MSVIIIGDVHGCLSTLKALISKLPTHAAHLCVTGDLIDRGKDSKGVVDFVMQNNIDCVKGNHEDLCVDAYTYTRRYLPREWVSNGGGAYFTNEQIEWMNSLPNSILYEDEMWNNRKLLVTHTMVNDLQEFVRRQQEVFWTRKSPIDLPEYYQVFGHTPTVLFNYGDFQPSEEPIITDYFAAIDTGCVFRLKLTALQFPEMKIYTQEYIDDY